MLTYEDDASGILCQPACQLEHPCNMLVGLPIPLALHCAWLDSNEEGMTLLGNGLHASIVALS